MTDNQLGGYDDGPLTLDRCGVCEVNFTEWMHQLDGDLAQFRVYGKGHTWASSVGLCDRCERLHQAGDESGLIAVYYRRWQETDEDVQEGIRNPLAALRRADLGAVAMAEWLPSGVVDAVRDGFTALSDLTGDAGLWAQWPEGHRRAVPETRSSWMDLSEDGMFLLVRSPWPDVPIRDVFHLIWGWVDERHPRSRRVPGEDRAARQARQAADDEARQTLQHQFLHLDQTSVLHYRATQPSTAD